MIALSLFSCLLDTSPELRQFADWRQATDYLCAPRQWQADKHPGWSPARFDGTRANANVRAITAVVWDYDQPTPIKDIRYRWAGVSGCVISTKSWTPDAPRWRVILFVSREMTPDEYRAVWRRLKPRAGTVDDACSDPARFWWVPSTADGSSPLREDLDGELLDVDAILAKPDPLPPPGTPPPNGGSDASRRALTALDCECGNISRATPGERHRTILHASLKLRRLVNAGELDEQLARDSLLDAARRCGEVEKYGEREVERWIGDGWEYNANAQPTVPLRQGSPPTPRSVPEERTDDAGEPIGDPPPMPGDDEAPQEARPARTLVLVGDLIDAALDQSERRQKREELPVPLPWASVAECHGGGYWPGLHVEVASTGKGKSQKALEEHAYAAQQGVPSGYIGLELDAHQIALRVLSAVGKLPWSKLWLGSCDVKLIEKARDLAPMVKGLPIACEYADPLGWPASRLIDFGRRFREKWPTGPGLITLDFLQLVSDEPGDRRELRERIGRAAYAARALVDMGLAVKAISSTARASYGLLTSPAKAAGLVVSKSPGRIGSARRILNPDMLVGLAKEAGEVEFSADSVATLIQWPEPLDNGDRAILYAVPKSRALPASWCALAFNGFGFTELPIQSLDDLPETHDSSNSVSADEYVSRVMNTIRTADSPLKSKRDVLSATKGEFRKVSAALDRAMADGLVERGADGVLRITAKQVECET